MPEISRFFGIAIKMFFDDVYDFEREEYIPYTSMYECAKRGVKYEEDYWEIRGDDYPPPEL